MRRLHRAPSGDRFVSCWWWHLAYWVEGWIWICFPSFAVWLYLHRFTVVSMLDQLSVKLKEGDKLGAIFQRILMSFSFQRPQLSFFKDFKWFPYLKVWLCGSFVWFSFLSGDDFSFHWLNIHTKRVGQGPSPWHCWDRALSQLLTSRRWRCCRVKNGRSSRKSNVGQRERDRFFLP